jgi:hypothetical protein
MNTTINSTDRDDHRVAVRMLAEAFLSALSEIRKSVNGDLDNLEAKMQDALRFGRGAALPQCAKDYAKMAETLFEDNACCEFEAERRKLCGVRSGKEHCGCRFCLDPHNCRCTYCKACCELNNVWSSRLDNSMQGTGLSTVMNTAFDWITGREARDLNDAMRELDGAVCHCVPPSEYERIADAAFAAAGYDANLLADDDGGDAIDNDEAAERTANAA